MNNDTRILRNLAQSYRDLCAQPDQTRRRDLWRRHNSLHAVRPPIYIRAFAWSEMPQSRCKCEDALYRVYEDFFRRMLFQATFDDDYIFESWVTVPAVHRTAGWGLAVYRTHSDEPGGSFKVDPPIKEPADIQKMIRPRHEIDEAETARTLGKITEAVGDIMAINVDRGPAYRVWSGDLSTDLGYLRGIEQVMWDMMDRPEWLHELLAFMRDGVLATHDQAERAEDWGLGDHQNQAMPYAEELRDPAANVRGVRRDHLWGYMASQELTLVGPDQWNEFMFEYQRPILERFGLTAYGCCEDLTRKIPYLRKLKNLRRIAVSPFANVAACAEAIGGDYVVSYRPSPADMVSFGMDEARIRRIVKADLEACKHNGCHVDITLKDVETVQGDPDRVRNWVRLVRTIVDEVFE